PPPRRPTPFPYTTLFRSGSPDELKRQVAGDVVTVGVGGHQDDALRLFQAQTFVREAGAEEDGTIRLYVERGEKAMPAILRLLDGDRKNTRLNSSHRTISY